MDRRFIPDANPEFSHDLVEIQVFHQRPSPKEAMLQIEFHAGDWPIFI
jgi:hypothetical protein